MSLQSTTAEPSPDAPTPAPQPDAAPSAFRMRSVGGHTAIYAIGTLLAKAIGFLMLPIYTKYLSPGDYGVLALIEMTLEVFAIVAGAQLAPGIFRFYHKANDDTARAQVVSTGLLTIGAGYAVVGSLCFAASGLLSALIFDSAGHAGLIRIAAIGLIFQSLAIVPMAYARVQDRSKLIVGANVARIVLAASLNVVFLAVLGWGVRSMIVSNLIGNLVVGAVLTVWAIRRTGIRFSVPAFRDLTRYGYPLVISYFAAFAYTFGDRYFLNAHADTNAVGLYNLAYQFGFLLTVVGFGSFEQVWGPKRFEIARRADRDAVLARGFLYVNLLLVSFGVLIGVYISDFLRIMTTPAFHAAGALVPVILLAYTFNAWSATQDIGILVSEKTRYITVANWASAAIALAAYALLIPRFLGWGAAFATLIALAARWAIIYVTSQRLWPVRYEWGPVARLLLAGSSVVLAGSLLPAQALLPSILSHTALFALYVIAVFTLPILSPDDERTVVTTLRGLLLRRGGQPPAFDGTALSGHRG